MFNIRKTIANNTLYAWMLIAILIIQSYAVSLPRPSMTPEAASKDKANFAKEIENNRALMQEAFIKNPRLALNFGYLTLYLLGMFLLGAILLAKFLLKKAQGEEPIPKTQNADAVIWSWKDAVRITIIFLFLNHIFSLFEHILMQFLKLPSTDKRTSIIFDTLFMDALILLFVAYFVAVKYKQKISALGISFANAVKNIGIAVFAYLAFLPVLAAILLSVIFVVNLLKYTPPAEPIYELIFKEQRPQFLILTSIMATFIGPVAEEVFFRGFLYPALKKSFNISIAIFITSVIFSLLHTNIVGFLPIVALGAFLAYLREKTGSLMPSICVHIMHNSILAGLMFLTRYAISIS